MQQLRQARFAGLSAMAAIYSEKKTNEIMATLAITRGVTKTGKVRVFQWGKKQTNKQTKQNKKKHGKIERKNAHFSRGKNGQNGKIGSVNPLQVARITFVLRELVKCVLVNVVSVDSDINSWSHHKVVKFSL